MPLSLTYVGEILSLYAMLGLSFLLPLAIFLSSNILSTLLTFLFFNRATLYSPSLLHISAIELSLLFSFGIHNYSLGSLLLLLGNVILLHQHYKRIIQTPPKTSASLTINSPPILDELSPSFPHSPNISPIHSSPITISPRHLLPALVFSFLIVIIGSNVLFAILLFLIKSKSEINISVGYVVGIYYSLSFYYYS